MLPRGSIQADGSLRVTSADPEGTVTEGIIFVNGLPVNNLGQLQCSTEPIVNYSMGLPFDAEGRLVIQDKQPVVAGDGYHGGLRVGALGVHIDDIGEAGSLTTDCFNGGIRYTSSGAVYMNSLFPTEGLLLLMKEGMVDSIGLSVDDYALLDVYWQSIFFTDPSTPILHTYAEWVAILSIDPLTNIQGGQVFYSTVRDEILVYSMSPVEAAERSLWKYLFSTQFEPLYVNNDALLVRGSQLYRKII